MLYNVPMENWSMIFKPRQRIHYWVVTNPKSDISLLLTLGGFHSFIFNNTQTLPVKGRWISQPAITVPWQKTVMYIWFVHLGTTTQKCEQPYPYLALPGNHITFPVTCFFFTPTRHFRWSFSSGHFCKTTFMVNTSSVACKLPSSRVVVWWQPAFLLEYTPWMVKHWNTLR